MDASDIDRSAGFGRVSGPRPATLAARRGVSPRDDAVTTIGLCTLRCRRPPGVGRDLRFTTGNRGLEVSFLLAASTADESFVDIDVTIWAGER